ncbi:MAG: FliA/WhiG family RNA polymerase sigma factor [Fimbriimonadales bacterium]
MALSIDQLKQAWIDCKVYKDPNARVELIDHYSYLVKITSGRLVANLPSGLDREDLIGAGVIGLIKSVDQYDPTREVKFETYAIALIRGAILELLRDEDWVPRSVREKLKALDRAHHQLEDQLGRAPTDLEVAERLGLPDVEVRELLMRSSRTGIYSLDDILVGSDGEDHIHYIEMIEDGDADTAEEAERREVRRVLARGVDALPERERLVVSLYYYEGLTFREIGQVLAVSESRIYQLHAQAMNRLKEFLHSDGTVTAGA